jgi:hypothetical protein
MKTYFVQLVFNNKDLFVNHNRYLSAILQAKSKEHAEQKIKDHYKQYYTAGDNGYFHVQCNWRIDIPTREIIEKHWRKASGSTGVLRSGKDLHEFQIDKTKKDVLQTWDCCNSAWASPAVHYSPEHNGYMVSLHNHMAMPSTFMLFKGSTKAVYDKAKKFVKDNTFKDDYYVPFE